MNSLGLWSSGREHSVINFTLKMEAPDSYDTLITIYQPTHCHNPDDHSWYLHCHKNVTFMLINTASFNAYLCIQMTHTLLCLILALKIPHF